MRSLLAVLVGAALLVGAWFASQSRSQLPLADAERESVTESEPAPAFLAGERRDAAETRAPALVHEEERPRPGSSAPSHAAEGRLMGTVTDEDGRPIAGARIFVETPSPRTFDARTNGHGRFEVRDLPLGRWNVVVRAVGYRDDASFVELSDGEPERVLELRLRAEALLRIRVQTSAGTPSWEFLQGAGLPPGFALDVVATKVRPGAVLDSDGPGYRTRKGIGTFLAGVTWRSEREPQDQIGHVRLHEDPPAWVSIVICGRVLGTRVVHAATEEITFTLDRSDVEAVFGGVRGRVASSASETSDGVLVSLHADIGGNSLLDARILAGEEFSFEPVAPGPAFLLVGAGGRARITLPIEVPPGEILDVGTLFPRSSAGLSVRAVDEWGRPLEKVVLEWGRIDTSTNELVRLQPGHEMANADGSRRIGNLEPGRWFVRSPGIHCGTDAFDSRRQSRTVEVELRADEETPVELVLQQATSVVIAFGRPALAWPRLRVLDERGRCLDTVRLGMWRESVTTHLLPGAYELVVEDGDVEITRRALTVGREPVRVELQLP